MAIRNDSPEAAAHVTNENGHQSSFDIKAEAKKLEGVANQFLSGKNEDQAFAAWHQELISLHEHGMEATKEVFHQMQKDTAGINPFLPKINIVDSKNSEQIQVTPSVPNALVGLNYRDLEGIVKPDSVYAGATAGRNLAVGQRELSAYTDGLSAPDGSEK